MPLVEVGGAAGGAVNVMAALMLALYVTSAFGRSRRSVRRSAVVVALLVGLAAVGAAWVIPAGAGVTLWAYISVVFGSFAKVRRRLLFSALALAVFAALGAGWVLIPSGVFAVLRLWNLLGAGSGEARCQASFPSKPTSHRPVDLGKQEVDDRVRPDQDNKKEPTLDGTCETTGCPTTPDRCCTRSMAGPVRQASTCSSKVGATDSTVSRSSGSVRTTRSGRYAVIWRCLPGRRRGRCSRTARPAPSC